MRRFKVSHSAPIEYLSVESHDNVQLAEVVPCSTLGVRRRRAINGSVRGELTRRVFGLRLSCAATGCPGAGDPWDGSLTSPALPSLASR
jgi:hypothetical protein